MCVVRLNDHLPKHGIRGNNRWSSKSGMCGDTCDNGGFFACDGVGKQSFYDG